MKVLNHEAGRVAVTLESDELVLLNNALNEILHGPAAVPAVEFPSRLGVTADDARSLMAQIQAALKSPAG